MLADLRFGFILLLISGLALSTKLAPSLLDGKAGQASTPTVGSTILADSTPEPSTPGGLTDVVPDGYSAAKETSATIAHEAKLDDAPVLAMPSLDESTPMESLSTASSHGGAEPASGVVVPLDEPPKSDAASPVENASKTETAEPKPLAPSKDEKPAEAASSGASANKGKKADSSTKKDEVVTEFVPFVEKLDEEKKSDAGQKKPKAKAVAAKAQGKAPKSDFHDDGESAGGLGDKHGASPKAEEQRHGKVRSYDAPARTVSDRKAPKDAAGAEPAHPFFRRYLESKRYFVRSGDSLESIAERLYGDAAKVDEILELNRSQLSSPSDVRPGMTLRLP